MSTDITAMYANPNMHEIVGSHDVVLITLDTLRFDVAQEEFAQDGIEAILIWRLQKRGV